MAAVELVEAAEVLVAMVVGALVAAVAETAAV